MEDLKKKFGGLLGNNADKSSNDKKSSDDKNPLKQFQSLFQKGGNNNAFSRNKKFGGQANTLGTSSSSKKLPPGTTLVQIHVPPPTSLGTSALGLKVEKNKDGGAIVAKVEEQSLASKIDFQRGDLICFPGSDGQELMIYEQFLALLEERKNNPNYPPLDFEVRRVVISTSKKNSFGGDSKNNAADGASADEFVKRQAMIAAAEERNKKFKQKMGAGGTSANKAKATVVRKQTSNELCEASATPMSEESKQAVEAAKASEQLDARNLGFNPYESSAVSAGQAKKTVVDTKHGEIGSQQEPSVMSVSSALTNAPSSIAPQIPLSNQNSTSVLAINEAFDTAFSTYLSSSYSSEDKTSLAIIYKVIWNAFHKADDDVKFSRVRLSNKKIQSNIVEKEGGMELMLAFGFALIEEEEQEMYLVYAADRDQWKVNALEYMQQYL